MKCDRCKQETEGVHIIAKEGESFKLCRVCVDVFNSFPTSLRMTDFLRDKSEMGKIERNMIEARERRASGQRMWID